MQETLTAKKKVHLGQGVAEMFGSAAQSVCFVIAALLQVLKFSNMLITIFSDGISGRDDLVPLGPHRFSGDHGCVPLCTKFIADSGHGGKFIRVYLFQSSQLGAEV